VVVITTHPVLADLTGLSNLEGTCEIAMAANPGIRLNACDTCEGNDAEAAAIELAPGAQSTWSG
jgi:hypothetical protein